MIWLIVLLILGLVAAPASPEIVEPGPDSGIVLRDQPGLLITDCRLHTQKVFVRLNPKEVLKKNVPDLLSTATREATTPLQAHLAYTLGSAVPIYVNPEDREIAFLINLPIIASGSIYRLKDVVNVGFWKEDTHLQIQTPPVVAYHDSNPDLYLAPNLRMCTRTTDIHYLCPSKPFVWDSTNGLCGLTPMVADTKCPTTARHRSQVTVTQAERVGHRWLVNTPSKTAIVNYDQHDTATHISLLDQTMWIEVPPNAILHIDDIALYYLNPEQFETEIEVPAFFSKHTLQLDPNTISQIQYAGTQIIDLTPVDDVLIDIRSQEKSPLQPIVYVWSTPDTLLAAAIVLGYLLTFGLTFIYVKRGKALQYKIDQCVTRLRLRRQPETEQGVEQPEEDQNEASADGEWFVVIPEVTPATNQPLPTQAPLAAPTEDAVPPPAPQDPQQQLEETNPIAHSGASQRRTPRTNAGQHPNPHHLPQAAQSRAIGATNSHTPGHTAFVFRPWQ
ncbi:uncharacterized protein LOC114468322 isoform X3 [Xyrichtys novacula]|uniref:Uncharacterized protein LOC114468322 isoform X3 n=1 Tax=Xyrichtys novacula TaxID=13765 RepID=A0AAV1FZX7_XYRNO|nr:uncharacterized protein LOC114468322 isoform X3 [Xyrichtys novacula]